MKTKSIKIVFLVFFMIIQSNICIATFNYLTPIISLLLVIIFTTINYLILKKIQK